MFATVVGSAGDGSDKADKSSGSVAGDEECASCSLPTLSNDGARVNWLAVGNWLIRDTGIIAAPFEWRSYTREALVKLTSDSIAFASDSKNDAY